MQCFWTIPISSYVCHISPVKWSALYPHIGQTHYIPIICYTEWVCTYWLSKSESHSIPLYPTNLLVATSYKCIPLLTSANGVYHLYHDIPVADSIGWWYYPQSAINISIIAAGLPNPQRLQILRETKKNVYLLYWLNNFPMFKDNPMIICIIWLVLKKILYMYTYKITSPHSQFWWYIYIITYIYYYVLISQDNP